MGVKSMKMEEEDEYEKEEKERERHVERLSNIILEESVIMLKDEMKVMDVVYEELRKVKSAMPQEEEPVLRTRAVSPKELLRPNGMKLSRRSCISCLKKNKPFAASMKWSSKPYKKNGV